MSFIEEKIEKKGVKETFGVWFGNGHIHLASDEALLEKQKIPFWLPGGRHNASRSDRVAQLGAVRRKIRS